MKISIITVCKDAASTIRTALESVRQQRVEGFELEHLVIDGGSTDGTVDVIKRFDDDRIFSFRWMSEPDNGLYDAINKGIRMAMGDVIGIVNADDVLAEDDTLIKIAAAFEKLEDVPCSTFNLQPSTSPLDAVYADVRFVKGGETVEALRAAPTTRYCTGRFFRNWMFRFATFPAHPSTFIRKSCFEKYGLYSLDYRICADFEMMLRLFRSQGIRTRYVPICTHVMRTGGLSTGGFRSNIQINREDLRALRAHGIWSCLPLIYLKYCAKIWGFVGVRMKR